MNKNQQMNLHLRVCDGRGVSVRVIRRRHLRFFLWSHFLLSWLGLRRERGEEERERGEEEGGKKDKKV